MCPILWRDYADYCGPTNRGNVVNTAANVPVTVTFNHLIRPYLVLRIGFAFAITVIGLPLALIWFCGVGQWWALHRCT